MNKKEKLNKLEDRWERKKEPNQARRPIGKEERAESS
jgi:hypothetical protein